jgi:hypothetical protein
LAPKALQGRMFIYLVSFFCRFGMVFG